MAEQRDDAGFSFVELLVVLLIVAVLTTIGLAMFTGFRESARDRSTQQMLVTAAKVEAGYSTELDGFNAAPAALAVLEPSIDFSGLTAESVHLVVADVTPGDQAQVLLYARSVSGTWFGIRLVNEGGLAGRHTCESDDPAVIADITACVGIGW